MFRTRAGYKRGKFLVKTAVSDFFAKVLVFGNELFERRIQRIYTNSKVLNK